LELDVIIVNYNSTSYLLRCLGSIYEARVSGGVKVLVQDNGSADEVTRIRAEFPEVILHENGVNLGFGKAVNRGFTGCCSRYVMVLNPDTVVSSGFFEAVLHYMESNPDVGILGPKITDPNGSVQGSARSFPTVLTGLFGRSCFLSRCFPGNALSRNNILACASDGRSPMEVDWVSGACMVVRKRAVDDVGLLDERFFMYWEDADWCRRMWESGWKVVYFPEACVVHHVGGSSKSARFRSLVEFHRSAYRLFAKHANGPKRLLKPLAFWTLGLRLLVLLCWHGVRKVIATSARAERRVGLGPAPGGRLETGLVKKEIVSATEGGMRSSSTTKTPRHEGEIA
jgi:GT2 family glycosyltransferase